MKYLNNCWLIRPAIQNRKKRNLISLTSSIIEVQINIRGNTMMKIKMISSLLALSLITTLTIKANVFGKNENKNPQLLKGSNKKEYQYIICTAQNDEVNFTDSILSINFARFDAVLLISR